MRLQLLAAAESSSLTDVLTATSEDVGPGEPISQRPQAHQRSVLLAAGVSLFIASVQDELLPNQSPNCFTLGLGLIVSLNTDPMLNDKHCTASSASTAAEDTLLRKRTAAEEQDEKVSIARTPCSMPCVSRRRATVLRLCLFHILQPTNTTILSHATFSPAAAANRQQKQITNPFLTAVELCFS